MKNNKYTFKEYDDQKPCEKCDAPCCKTLLIPHKTPINWMDLDFIRYLLNFQTVEVAVSKEGNWAIIVHQKCFYLDEQTHLCKVHDTKEKPKTCIYFNPYQCYYKANLSNKNPPNLYILNRHRFEKWTKHIYFDENGNIVDAPGFEKSIQILRD